MAQKYWVGVAVADHIRIGFDEGFCAFSHGKHQAVSKLNLGDRFVYYATKTSFQDGQTTGAPVQAFMAAGEVTGEVQENHIAGYPAYTRKARYQPLFEVPVKPLITRLHFVKNPQYWGMAFRRSLFEIDEHDYQVIMDAQ